MIARRYRDLAEPDHRQPRLIQPIVKELGQRIQKTLDLLPEEYRLLLLLVADQQMSYDAIATLTRQSADAVRGKLHRARKAFVARFQKLA